MELKDLIDKINLPEPNDDDLYPLEIEEVVHITEKAVLVRLTGVGEKWIPLSVIRSNYRGDTVVCLKWFYDKEID